MSSLLDAPAGWVLLTSSNMKEEEKMGEARVVRPTTRNEPSWSGEESSVQSILNQKMLISSWIIRGAFLVECLSAALSAGERRQVRQPRQPFHGQFSRARDEISERWVSFVNKMIQYEIVDGKAGQFEYSPPRHAPQSHRIVEITHLTSISIYNDTSLMALAAWTSLREYCPCRTQTAVAWCDEAQVEHSSNLKECSAHGNTMVDTLVCGSTSDTFGDEVHQQYCASTVPAVQTAVEEHYADFTAVLHMYVTRLDEAQKDAAVTPLQRLELARQAYQDISHAYQSDIAARGAAQQWIVWTVVHVLSQMCFAVMMTQ